MFIFPIHCDVDFGHHAGRPDTSRGAGPAQNNGSAIATKITMAVYKTDYCNSSDIFMVPLVWYMYMQNCIAINELHCNMHILPKFQIC